MNILEILKLLGWEIISADNKKQQYTITESIERVQRETEQDGRIYGETTVTIGDVSFDEFGNLYIIFQDAYTGHYVDNFVYNRMEKNEIYI